MTNTRSKIHICLIGNGRLASHLRLFLNQNLYTFSQVFRSQHSDSEITKEIQIATHVWLAIPDRSIEDFYCQYSHRNESNKTWVHFSGAHNSKNIHSAHPLMTFSKTLMNLSDLAKVHFVVSAPAEKTEDCKPLTDLLPGFKNPWSLLNPDKKAFYHALCVVAGNFPMILWSEVLTQFRSLDLPAEALYVYLDRVLANFKNEGSVALTGPIVRHDLTTIKDNLTALDGHMLKPIYESFVKAKGISL